MNEISTIRTPMLIAAEINSIKQQTRTMVLCNSIEIGRRLTEAKGMIEHGAWGEWLEKSVDYSPRTAQNLMKIFDEYGADQLSLFGNNAKTQALADLSYTQAVALLGIPAEEREEFIEEHDLDSMTTRELQQAIKEKQELEERLAAVKEKAQEIYDERDQLKEKADALEIHMQTISTKLTAADQQLTEAQTVAQSLKDTLEAERKRARADLEKLSLQLVEAQAEDGDDKTVKRLEYELQIAKEKSAALTKDIDALKADLAKPAEVATVTVEVEKVPEDVAKELEELRKKAGQQADPLTTKFKVYFDVLVKDFSDLLVTLAAVKQQDITTGEKYKAAISGLLEKMKVSL